jgi:hypothetical protein
MRKMNKRKEEKGKTRRRLEGINASVAWGYPV